MSLVGKARQILGLSVPSASAAPTRTYGTSGTPVWGGYVETREKNSSLVGQERYTTFSEIVTNTSIVAASLRYFINLVAKASWRVEPAEGRDVDRDEAQRVADLIEANLYSMETPWSRIIKRAAMYRFYGFGVQEWTAELVDGNIRFANIAARPQKTIEKWAVEESGRVLGMFQRSPHDGREIWLPRQKVLYLVDDTLNDSPEGLGLARHLVEPVNRLRRYEQLEGFGFESDLRGVPIGRAPLSVLNNLVSQGLITEADKNKMLSGLQEFLGKHVKTPNLALLIDSQPFTSEDESATPSGTQQWNVDILRGNSEGQTEVANAITRVNTEIARILNTEHLLLGEGSRGSQALSKDKTHSFALTVDATLLEIGEVYDQDMSGRLLDLNGIEKKYCPTLKPESVKYRDVEQISSALRDMAAAGAILSPDDPAIGEMRDMLGMTRPTLTLLAEDAAISGARVRSPRAPSDGPQADPNPRDPVDPEAQ